MPAKKSSLFLSFFPFDTVLLVATMILSTEALSFVKSTIVRKMQYPLQRIHGHQSIRLNFPPYAQQSNHRNNKRLFACYSGVCCPAQLIQQSAKIQKMTTNIPHHRTFARKSRTDTFLLKMTWDNNNNNSLAVHDELNSTMARFLPGTKIQVEVVSFGPLGATVDVIALGSHDPDDLIPETEPPFATGLILQREIHYFRESRNNVDVVLGEILPAYIERIRVEEDDNDNETTRKDKPIRLDISLRGFGGKAKVDGFSGVLIAALNDSVDGTIPVGDKSLPEDISRIFPGISKATFKKTVAALYKQRLVQPGPFSISLIKTNEQS